MKKSIISFSFIILSLFSLLTFSSCDKKSFLLPHVSELRSNVYEGYGEKYFLKCYYGYKENPYVNDGKVGTSAYTLTFILKGAEGEDIAFSLDFPHVVETIEFEKTSSGQLRACINVENFTEKEFMVNLLYSSEYEAINMISVIPEDTMDINGILKEVEKSQSALINSYFVDLEFSAEIYARVIVRDKNPYWYIAIGDGKTLKAFLADGRTGEILAIREVL